MALAARRKHEKGAAVGWILAVIVILLLIGVVVYAVYNRNWQTADVNDQVRGAVDSVRGASENAVTTSKVKTALALSKHVSAFDINVDTDGEIVTLQGRVPSRETRRIAEEIARDTSGVKQVRNQLTIDSSAKPDPEAARLGTRVSDIEVRTSLEDLYQKEQALRDDTIQTEVVDGVVTLEGDVDSAEEKRTAEARAWEMEDVKEVRNNLKVRREEEGGEQPRDQLARRVEFELYSSRAFNLEPIEVRSNEGVIILQGEVRSNAEKLLAEKLAQEVDGVKSVRNSLSVATMTEAPTMPAE